MTRRGNVGTRVAADGGTRQKIIAAGTALFAERGSAASSMRELAERAGVALSASYYHFPGKRDVLLAIMTEAMEHLERGAVEVLARDLPPIERLPELVQAHVRMHLEEPDLARVADGELRALDPEAREEIVAIRDRYEDYFRTVLAAGIEDGSFSPTLDVPVTAIALITMGTATVEWWRPDGRLSIDETASILSRMAVVMAVHGYEDRPVAPSSV
jgi:AcrR family transcriptional regulator